MNTRRTPPSFPSLLAPDLLRTSIVAAHVLALFGCSAGVDDRDSGPSFGGTGDTDAGDGAADTGGSSDDGTAGGAGSGPGPGSDSGTDRGAEDSGGETGDSGPATVRCDKIDFLFVLESPWSTGENGSVEHYNSYIKLREGFESLVSDLYVSVEVDDFRVLVTTSTPMPEELTCDKDWADSGCPAMAVVDACDMQLGAGRNGLVIPEWGVDECMPGRYLESGAPDLSSTFTCLVEYGLNDFGWWPYYYANGGEDRLMDAMSLALGPQAMPGACNAGFLREDALLVVVLVEQGGDTEPDVSEGSIQSWHDAIASAKHGVESNIVVLGLSPDGGDPQPLCAPGESDELGAKVRELVDGFPHGKWASSCLPDYVPFFDVAAEIIDGACEELVPAG